MSLIDFISVMSRIAIPLIPTGENGGTLAVANLQVSCKNGGKCPSHSEKKFDYNTTDFYLISFS